MPAPTFSLPIPTPGQTTKQALDAETNRVLSSVYNGAIAAASDPALAQAVADSVAGDSATAATARDDAEAAATRAETAAAGVEFPVSYAPQSLTPNQMLQARENIDASREVFDSLDDVKATPGLSVGDKIRTLGYFAPGDGGGGDYDIVAAATGTDDGGSFIDLPESGLQAKGLFDGRVVRAERFGAVDGVEASAAINAANDFAVSQAELLTDDPLLGTRARVMMAMSANVTIKDEITFGATVSRNYDLDLRGSLIVCVPGGNLTASSPAAQVFGETSVRHLCRINCSKLCSGWSIRGQNSFTHNPVALSFNGAGYGVRISNSRGGTIYHPWAWEYSPEDEGAGVASNYVGTAVRLEDADYTVIGGHPGWSGTAFHITENCAFLVLLNPHPYCNKATNRETDPRIDPIAILNDSPNSNFISDAYVDGGYVVDNTGSLQMNGGFHYMSPTALPGVSTPYTRIKNVFGVNDKRFTGRGFRSSFGLFETNYTDPDLAIWNTMGGTIQNGRSQDIYRQHQVFYTGNLGASPHKIEALNSGGNIRKRQVFAGGEYVEEENGLFSGAVGRFIRAAIARLDGSALGGTTQLLIGPLVTGLRNNHDNKRLEFLVDSATSRWHMATDGGFRPSVDLAGNIGSAELRPDNSYAQQFRPGTGSAIWTAGQDSPEGVVTAIRGSLYLRTNGGAGTTLYVKESGTGNTGWVAK